MLLLLQNTIYLWIFNFYMQQGKGEMNTYWLVESTRKHYNSPGMSKYQLPGEVEPEEGSTVSIMQEQGTSEVKGSYRQRESLTDYM